VGEKPSRASTQSISIKAGGGGGEKKSSQTPENGTARTDRTSPNDDAPFLWDDIPFAAYAAVPSSPLPRRAHLVPTGCVGPTACAAIGVCGRSSCVSPAESDAFAVAMVHARRTTNPHVVPDFYVNDLSKEVDRAA